MTGFFISVLCAIVLVFVIAYKLTAEKEPEPDDSKSYEFSTSEACCVGDWYRYTVTANSKEEAFKKLVEMFYGTAGLAHRDVKSSSGTVSYPGRDMFRYYGMPGWFASMISGRARGENYESCKRALVKYCKEHGITLRDPYNTSDFGGDC